MGCYGNRQTVILMGFRSSRKRSAVDDTAPTANDLGGGVEDQLGGLQDGGPDVIRRLIGTSSNAKPSVDTRVPLAVNVPRQHRARRTELLQVSTSFGRSHSMK